MNANSGQTIPIKLVGSPACRRYQKMRTAVLDIAAHLGVQIIIEEISEVEKLAQFNSLSLPRLHINGQMVASKNPPSVDQIAQIFAQES